VQRVYEYGVGHQAGDADQKVLEVAGQKFATNGHRFADLVRSIAVSPEFRTVAKPEPLTRTKVAVLGNPHSSEARR
jgi:hypothetical protein